MAHDRRDGTVLIGITVGEITSAGPAAIGRTLPPAGAGTYQGCSTNVSSAQTIGQLQLFVDKEVH